MNKYTSYIKYAIPCNLQVPVDLFDWLEHLIITLLIKKLKTVINTPFCTCSILLPCLDVNYSVRTCTSVEDQPQKWPFLRVNALAIEPS